MSIVAGVDGRRGGWALVLVDAGRRAGPRPPPRVVDIVTVAGQDADGLRALLRTCRDAGAVAVGVDVPIGMPRDTWRQADLLAKRRLGRGSARVFLTAPRGVLAEPTYADARRTCREVMGGKGLSAQAYGIRGPVLAVDEVLARPGWAREHVVEVHPELAFMTLAGRPPGSPLAGKRTAEGAQERLAALEPWLPGVRDVQLPDGDDHLDALAAAWSAERWSRGAAEVLGGDPDATGLPMRIVV